MGRGEVSAHLLAAVLGLLLVALGLLGAVYGVLLVQLQHLHLLLDGVHGGGGEGSGGHGSVGRSVGRSSGGWRRAQRSPDFISRSSRPAPSPATAIYGAQPPAGGGGRGGGGQGQ